MITTHLQEQTSYVLRYLYDCLQSKRNEHTFDDLMRRFFNYDPDDMKKILLHLKSQGLICDDGGVYYVD